MRKNILIALIAPLFLLNYSSSNEIDKKNNIDNKSYNKVVNEINEFNQIILLKLSKAAELEVLSASLSGVENSEKKSELLKQAKLERMRTLKYKAAIACKENFLKRNY